MEPGGEHHLGSAAVAAISSIILGHANALTATVAPGGRSAPAAFEFFAPASARIGDEANIGYIGRDKDEVSQRCSVGCKELLDL